MRTVAAVPGPSSNQSRPEEAFNWRHALLLGGAAFAVSPWATPELGLTLGLILGLSGLSAAGALSRAASRWLIQIAVVLLGFRMDLHQVLGAGAVGLMLAVGVVLTTVALGIVLGRVLRTGREITALISSGTAICGGSAIAAVAATIRAQAASISIALGAVFILNAVSLYLFPQVGVLLEMTPRQFGAWAGIAIHDVSSVVGAASSFRSGTPEGALALETATVIKLSRVLWIAPVCLAAAWLFRAQRGGAKIGSLVPWYIPLFLVAATLRTMLPQIDAVSAEILLISKRGMTLALFLIGAGLTRQALASLGWRPLAQGVILWIVIAAGSLVVVLAVIE